LNTSLQKLGEKLLLGQQKASSSIARSCWPIKKTAGTFRKNPRGETAVFTFSVCGG
jgi:hypothetical protein